MILLLDHLSISAGVCRTCQRTQNKITLCKLMSVWLATVCWTVKSNFKSKSEKNLFYFLLLVFYSCKVGDEVINSELKHQSCYIVNQIRQNDSRVVKISNLNLAWRYLRNIRNIYGWKERRTKKPKTLDLVRLFYLISFLENFIGWCFPNSKRLGSTKIVNAFRPDAFFLFSRLSIQRSISSCVWQIWIQALWK